MHGVHQDQTFCLGGRNIHGKALHTTFLCHLINQAVLDRFNCFRQKDTTAQPDSSLISFAMQAF